MKGWEFINDDGTFSLKDADKIRGLYFPVANEAGYMASLAPDGGGDAKTGQHHFLMPPVSALDLHNSRLKRTAWVCAEGFEPWSATGASHRQKSMADESQDVEAGLLWHRSMRRSATGTWETEILTFCPRGDEKLEISRICIKNSSKEDLEFSLIPVTPLYGRSADSLRDHRHVTSLLNRVYIAESGVHLKPSMSFDERGHRKNSTVYSVLGRDSRGAYPEGSCPDLDRFIGEPGDAEQPMAVYDGNYRAGVLKKAGSRAEGCEAVGALFFPKVTLSPGEGYSVYMVSGIFESPEEAEKAAVRYCSESRCMAAFKANREFWLEKTAPVLCKLPDRRFSRWMRWVSVQPVLRRIYGCSFLPWHDYGRGGRGWRDLWQDCLALLLMEPHDVGGLLFSNFAGVRFDGTNATIIGNKPGSFLADRNSIPRVWMDHGAWPVLTVRLYIDQTGDLDFLTRGQTYFSDSLWARATALIQASPDTLLKTQRGGVCSGTLFEHMLLQQLSSFFHVGAHNCLRLEGADWNDGLDMAAEKGESVAFSALYAENILWLADAAERLEEAGKELLIAEELLLLLDRYRGEKINYHDPETKNELLQRYFDAAARGPSGRQIRTDAASLSADLREKANHLLLHIREQEWIENSNGHGWFNGYYDNRSRRVEGNFPDGVRMTLTGQVFSLMSGAATDDQVKKVIAAVDSYLLDPVTGAYRLNTDFKEVKLDLGRCFGFAYGHKENGAVFSHMAVMYACALYDRREAAAAWKVMGGLYEAAAAFEQSRLYPGLPEYFDPDGRGLYSYLTGSASWYLLVLVTRVFGVRGFWGDLLLDPQLSFEQWGNEDTVSISTCFRGRKLTVEYGRPEGPETSDYRVKEVWINGSPAEFHAEKHGIRIPSAGLPEKNLLIRVETGA
jgi:cellobiose phosphorylase